MTADRVVVALVLAVICGGAIGLAFLITWALNQAIALAYRIQHRKNRPAS